MTDAPRKPRDRTGTKYILIVIQYINARILPVFGKQTIFRTFRLEAKVFQNIADAEDNNLLSSFSSYSLELRSEHIVATMGLIFKKKKVCDAIKRKTGDSYFPVGSAFSMLADVL